MIAAGVVSLVLALAAPAALAAEPMSGYGQEPPRPQVTAKPETVATTPSPSEEPPRPESTSPSQETSKPESSKPEYPEGGPIAEQAKVEPAGDYAAAHTLPFTGLDLRWLIGIGLLMTGTGCLILLAQRRRRYSD